MKQFVKGFLLGGLLAGAYTLLTNENDGATNLKATKDYVNGLKEEGTTVQSQVQQLQSGVKDLTQNGLPLVMDLVDQVQVDIRHFMESNQPRINRVLWSINKLQEDLKGFSGSEESSND